MRACGKSSRLVAAAFLHASGHDAALCSRLCPPGAWALLTAQQPRLCLQRPQQPVTPQSSYAAAAVAVTPVTDLSDAASPPAGGVLLDVIPMQLESPAGVKMR